jgi:hypothetical protein
VISRSKLLWLAVLVCSLHSFAADRDQKPVAPAAANHPPFATLHIPKLEKGPTIEDFLEMRPSPEFASTMLKIDQFFQRDPKDGAAPTFAT